ncbi:MAG: peroxiredoxin [Acetobacteraceae bacterium]|nr:peroxiredoxin [Acetobacteraceae bacterium]
MGQERNVRPPCPPMLYDRAPEFRARSTHGEISLAGYRGRWLLFFSHPADFTPVCTSEFISMARAADRFAALNCALLALSVDSLFAHLAWVCSIRNHFGVEIPFPIIEDPSMAIARAYGMIHPRAPDAATVRAVFVIDPEGVIRAITWYPMTVGRNVEELLRLVAALQVTDRHDVSTPEGWRPGQAVLLPPSLQAGSGPGAPAEDWYYRTIELPADPTGTAPR